MLVRYVHEFLTRLPKNYSFAICSWVFKVIKERIMLVRYLINNPFMSECSHISEHFVEIRKSNFPLWNLQWKKCQWSKILVIHVPLIHLISWYQNHSLKNVSPFWNPGQFFLDHVLMKWGQPQNRDKFFKEWFWYNEF